MHAVIDIPAFKQTQSGPFARSVSALHPQQGFTSSWH